MEGAAVLERDEATAGASGRSERAQETALDLADYRATGVTFVVVVTSERREACPACSREAGRVYRLERAPRPPFSGCAGACTCRLAPLWLE